MLDNRFYLWVHIKMKCKELKNLLNSYGFDADIYKSGKSVLLDLSDNFFADQIIEILDHCGCKYYRENPRFLPEVFTVEWRTRQ